MEAVYEHLRFLREKYPKLRISFVSGNFNIIHTGHIRLLRFAREIADLLVVGVVPRNDYNAKFSEEDRLEGVRSLSSVDHACVLQGPLEGALRLLRPDFVVKGKEHEQMENVERSVLDEYGGKLVFSAGFVRPSEADMARVEDESGRLPLHIPADYCGRRSIRPDVLQKILDSIASLRVCVIGDVIVDEYIACDPLGMSQEDPTIVVSPTKTWRFLGGAGIVAAHAAGLGAKVHFCTVCGEDATAAYVKEKLEEYGVSPAIFCDASRPTTLKQRYRCQEKTLLRVSHLRQHAVGKDICAQVRERVSALLPELDLLIFSDFNYGCLPQFLVDGLTEEARRQGVPFAADSQSSSQMGDVSRFSGAILLTPTEREARLAMRDFESGLVVLGTELMAKADARNILMTLGRSGVLIQHSHTHDPAANGSGGTDSLPALNPVARDTSGAGDSMLTATALGLAAGHDIWHSSYLGSIAAALQVSRVGNVPLSRSDLARHLSY